MARVRKGDFVISVRTRGDIKSARSIDSEGAAGSRAAHRPPGRQRPPGEARATWWWSSMASQQEQNVITRTTNVRAVDGDITQMKATQKIDDEADAMSKMSSEYDLERAKLDASKAEVLSRHRRREEPHQVGVSEGALQQVKASINAHQVGHRGRPGPPRPAQRQGRSRSRPGAELPEHDADCARPSTASSTCCRISARRARSGSPRRRSKKATTPGPAPRSPKFPTSRRCISI